MTSPSTRVLVVGMGLMGSALADALLHAGHDVTVWNRTQERCNPAIKAGAGLASSVVEGARRCDVMISCLANHEAVADCVTSSNVGRALAGRTLVQLSQATPEQSQAFAAWAAEYDVSYLEGSILSYPKDVRAGHCDIIYAGDPATFEDCRHVLHSMGGRPRLVGDRPGMATAFDKAFFAFYYGHLMGLLQGAAICRAANVPLEGFLDLMVDDYNWKLPDSVTAAALRADDFSVREGALETHAHAFNQVVPFCRKLGIEPGLPDAIDAVLKAGIDAGHGADEIASLVEILGSQQPSS